MRNSKPSKSRNACIAVLSSFFQVFLILEMYNFGSNIKTNIFFSGKSQREFEPSKNARWGSNGAKGQSLPSSANNYQKWGGIEKIVPKMWIRPRKTQTATDPYYEYPSKYNLSYISCVNGKSLGPVLYTVETCSCPFVR